MQFDSASIFKKKMTSSSIIKYYFYLFRVSVILSRNFDEIFHNTHYLFEINNWPIWDFTFLSFFTHSDCNIFCARELVRCISQSTSSSWSMSRRNERGILKRRNANQWLSKTVQPIASWNMDIAAGPLASISPICHAYPPVGSIHPVHN